MLEKIKEKFNKQENDNKITELTEQLNKIGKEINVYKSKEQAEKNRIERIKREKIAKQKIEETQRALFWINRKASDRFLKLLIDLKQAQDPIGYFSRNVVESDNYKLKKFFELLDNTCDSK